MPYKLVLGIPEGDSDTGGIRAIDRAKLFAGQKLEFSFFVGPVAPGAASNLLTSSACSVDVANATATQLADRLQEKVPVVLKAPMSGAKKMFMRSQDVLGRDSGWVQVGTYQVP